MTNNEIVKGLRCCSKDRPRTTKDCMHECPYFNVLSCQRHCMRDALDLINHQQAENERNLKRISNLKHALFEQQSYTAKLQKELATAKSEAYKEFAERLKEEQEFHVDECDRFVGFVAVSRIDNLLKEMG